MFIRHTRKAFLGFLQWCIIPPWFHRLLTRQNASHTFGPRAETSSDVLSPGTVGRPINQSPRHEKLAFSFAILSSTDSSSGLHFLIWAAGSCTHWYRDLFLCIGGPGYFPLAILPSTRSIPYLPPTLLLGFSFSCFSLLSLPFLYHYFFSLVCVLREGIVSSESWMPVSWLASSTFLFLLALLALLARLPHHWLCLCR